MHACIICTVVAKEVHLSREQCIKKCEEIKSVAPLISYTQLEALVIQQGNQFVEIK